ncbi:hypothetical protein ICM_06304 [Bacillus cereus BAG1X2-3]|nr:hypothetical protein ICC_06566 [Bacillus cereus BAG1X1-1]EOO42405.1 hypothetical protein ICI_06566 [Bacillus cereus BAG1X2-1]EOO43971.1 hypothetical protein ICK_06664 [Bacillus cereus BAG1X2-2]EOO56003.1 hypothetical protein ICM_06304 [Bacillus cereus BAG1X2-3]EOO99943.1 hypothetical protein ICO_06715 [Bacillus cereus BAG2O-1]
MEKVSKILGVTKSTVQTTLERADEKIKIQISESLFCMVG